MADELCACPLNCAFYVQRRKGYCPVRAQEETPGQEKSTAGDRWELLYGSLQGAAAGARAVGNRDRERAFLDALHLMDELAKEG